VNKSFFAKEVFVMLDLACVKAPALLRTKSEVLLPSVTLFRFFAAVKKVMCTAGLE